MFPRLGELDVRILCLVIFGREYSPDWTKWIAGRAQRGGMWHQYTTEFFSDSKKIYCVVFIRIEWKVVDPLSSQPVNVPRDEVFWSHRTEIPCCAWVTNKQQVQHSSLGFHGNYVNGCALPALVAGFPRCVRTQSVPCIYGSRGFHGNYVNGCVLPTLFAGFPRYLHT